jgi:hypothetical protein
MNTWRENVENLQAPDGWPRDFTLDPGRMA